MFAQHSHELFVLLELVCDSLHFEVKIWTVNAGSNHTKLSDIKLLFDVCCDFGSRSRSQREHRRRTKRLHCRTECKISRTEVVTPFRDAVSFVNHDEVDRLLSQLSEKFGCCKSLGRDEDEIALLRFDLLEVFLMLARAEGAVQLRSFQTSVFQLVDLIFHQRNERRDDDRRSGKMQRR